VRMLEEAHSVELRSGVELGELVGAEEPSLLLVVSFRSRRIFGIDEASFLLGKTCRDLVLRSA
jgi:hypothetical protein